MLFRSTTSELLNRLSIFSKIGGEIERQIRLFDVFNDNKLQNLSFMSSDDKVFGFGSNGFGCCGLGHNNVVNEPQIIPELCHKNIQQVFQTRNQKNYFNAYSFANIFSQTFENI